MLSLRNWLKPYADEAYGKAMQEKTGRWGYQEVCDFAKGIVRYPEFPYTSDIGQMRRFLYQYGLEHLEGALEETYVEYVYSYVSQANPTLYRKIVAEWIYEEKAEYDDCYYQGHISGLLYIQGLFSCREKLKSCGSRYLFWLSEEEVWRVIWDVIENHSELTESDIKQIESLQDLWNTKHGALLQQFLMLCKEYVHKQEYYVRSQVTPKVRMQVLSRDDYTCQICGRSRKDGVKLEVDHKIPVAKGGTSELSNLWTLCFDCNRGKSDSVL